MTDRFTLLRVLYHQRIEAFLGFGSQKRSLAHCDRAFVMLVDKESWPDKEIMDKIAFKVYQYRIKKNDSFVALLEVNVQEPVQVNKWYESKYCFLMAVVCLPGKNDLFCVPLTVNSFLGPNNKCFELTDNNCLQRSYHIISASQNLANYKCLMAPQHSWIFVLDLSNTAASSLITANEYIALGSEQKLYSVNSKSKPGGFYSKSKNSPKELLRGGDGILVKYGAILAGEPKNRPSEEMSNSYIFIGEFASRLAKFSHIQERVNLTNVIDKDSAWPALPKHDDGCSGEERNTEEEKESEQEAETMAPTVCDDGQTVSSLDEEYFEDEASQAEDPLDQQAREQAVEVDQLSTGGDESIALLPYTPPAQLVYVHPWNYSSQVMFGLYPMANPICYCNCAQMNYYANQNHLE